MAEPVSPVLIQGKVPQEFIIAAPENSEGINPMPVLMTNQHMVTRWRLSEAERKAVALSGDVWICWLGNLLPPHIVIAFPPVLDASGDVAMVIDSQGDPLSKMEEEMKGFKP